MHDEPYLHLIPIRFFRNDIRYPMTSCSIVNSLPRGAGLVAEFSLYFPATYAFAAARRLGRLRRLAFHTHGPNLTRDPGRMIARASDAVRLRLFHAADIVATYTKAGAEWISQVAPRVRTVAVENTIDVAAPRQAKAEVKAPRRLGHPQMLFCGRLNAERNAPMLLDVFDRVAEWFPQARLVVIGSGQDLSVLQRGRALRHDDERIVILDSIYDEHLLAPWFAGSDVFVMPGPGGLSINHALAYDLPVVAFRSGARGAFHGPEIDYIVDGETGSLVDRARGAEGLASAVMAVAGDTDLLSTFKQRIPQFVDERLQIETMVRNFGVVDEALRS